MINPSRDFDTLVDEYVDAALHRAEDVDSVEQDLLARSDTDTKDLLAVYRMADLLILIATKMDSSLVAESMSRIEERLLRIGN